MNGALNVEYLGGGWLDYYNQGVVSEQNKNMLAQALVENLIHKEDSRNSSLANSESSQALKAPSTKTLEDYGKSWQEADHSVLLIGWGFDEKTKTKYWILRNSYGVSFGKEGHLLVKRGNNDFGIESSVSAYDPVLCQDGSSTSCNPI